MNLEEILNKTDLFKDIESPEKLFAQSDWEYKHFTSGESIASTFDDCINFSIVVYGSAEIQNIYPSGKISSLKKISAMELFGESIIPGRIHSYPSDIIALEKTEVLFIRKTAILKAVKTDDALLENYIGLLSSKLLMMNEKIKMLSLETLRKKISWFLIEMHNKQNSLELKIPYNQEELANALGSQRPSISREMSRMQKDGLIEYHRRKVTIKNLSKLQDLLR
jgi:CRP-like cAMP-binding protein